MQLADPVVEERSMFTQLHVHSNHVLLSSELYVDAAASCLRQSRIAHHVQCCCYAEILLLTVLLLC